MKKSYVIGALTLIFILASIFVIWFSLDATRQAQEIRGQAYGNNAGSGTGGNTGSGGSTGGQTGGGSATCSENPVNVQFRKWTGNDTPWISGGELTLKTGEFVDVNCFARNGSALLQNAQFVVTLTNNAQTETLNIPTDGNGQIRKMAISKAGQYRFVCRNSNNSCSDTDQFTVSGSTACKRTGCSGQLCVDSAAQDVVTTCEFKPEHACYQQAECKVQANGQCGFTDTDTLRSCLARANPSPTPGVSPSPGVSCADGRYAVSDLNRDCRTDVQDFNLFLVDFRQRVLN